MTFTEKMAVWTLVLDYLKVILGYPVTIPALILALCWLFRSRIAQALDSLLEVTFPGGSAKFERRRVEQQEMLKYSANVERATGVTARSVLNQVPQAEAVAIQAMVAFFHLAARLLPLIPKAERRRFIEETLHDVPKEYETFHASLFQLANDAPEVHTLKADEVLGIGLGEVGRVTVIPPPPV